MGYSPRITEDIIYDIHQCQHCGDWLNDKGFVDLMRSPKLKTTKQKYCKNCRTLALRKALDEANAKILSKK